MMAAKRKDQSLFERLRSGLQDSIAYSKGELSLRTTELPAPPPPAGANDIRSLRSSMKMSQAVFAATLNVATKTVQGWEQGTRRPSDAALRLIQIVRQNPDIVAKIGRRTSTQRKATRGPLTLRARSIVTSTKARRRNVRK